MRDADLPLLEFDDSPTALIEPALTVGDERVPERVVLCFFADVLARVTADRPVARRFRSEVGESPVWIIGEGDDAVGVTHPGVGAPMAAAFLEEAIGAGARRVVAVGGAGALVPELTLGHVVVPTAAVRDEGTSFHYLPPSREVEADAATLRTTIDLLERRDVPYTTAKTWTTDAIYRETPARIARRRDEGCVTVEMEAAAFLAVARFRGIRFAQLLYAADDLTGETWDHRDWMAAGGVRESMFWLAVDLVRALES